MPRANLKKVKETVAIAVDMAVSKLQAERELDSAHIEKHAEFSRARIITLQGEKAKFITLVEDARAEMNASLDNLIAGGNILIDTLIEAEQTRLTSLEAHADDINDDGSDPEPLTIVKKNVSRIKG